jgi:hypothetical protein
MKMKRLISLMVVLLVVFSGMVIAEEPCDNAHKDFKVTCTSMCTNAECSLSGSKDATKLEVSTKTETKTVYFNPDTEMVREEFTEGPNKGKSTLKGSDGKTITLPTQALQGSEKYEPTGVSESGGVYKITYRNGGTLTWKKQENGFEYSELVIPSPTPGVSPIYIKTWTLGKDKVIENADGSFNYNGKDYAQGIGSPTEILLKDEQGNIQLVVSPTADGTTTMIHSCDGDCLDGARTETVFNKDGTKTIKSWDKDGKEGNSAVYKTVNNKDYLYSEKDGDKGTIFYHVGQEGLKGRPKGYGTSEVFAEVNYETGEVNQINVYAGSEEGSWVPKGDNYCKVGTCSSNNPTLKTAKDLGAEDEIIKAKEIRDAKQEEFWDSDYGWAKVADAAASLREYNAYGLAYQVEWYQDWINDVDAFFTQNYLGIDSWTSAICEASYPIEDADGSESVGIIKTDSDTYQFVGHIEAERTKVGFLFCEAETEEDDEGLLVETGDYVCPGELYCNEDDLRCYEDEDYTEGANGYFYKITWGVTAPRDEEFTSMRKEGGEDAITFNIELRTIKDKDGQLVYKDAATQELTKDALSLNVGHISSELYPEIIVDYTGDIFYQEVCIVWGDAPQTVNTGYFWKGEGAHRSIGPICTDIKKSEATELKQGDTVGVSPKQPGEYCGLEGECVK